ncbi:alpha/beta hydrolase [Kocuria sp. M1R5S2]|uniref:alpha/beta hydrolase n=1 Tax=Kocuria rhizosphaerae TaxID=3376285 RepID=UPI0037A70A61
MIRTVSFDSGGTSCTARLYRPAGDDPRPCVVMGHGFTGTQDQLTPQAELFAEQGLAVLTFDYRHFGASGGHPRQVVDVGEQLEDWRAAVDLARRLPEVDPEALALWGSSFSGGHVLRLAAEDPAIRAVVVQVPEFGMGAGSVADEIRAKRQRKGVPLRTILGVGTRLLGAAVRDEVRARRGRPPHLLPVFAPPGGIGAVIDPRHQRFLARAEETGPTWRNEFAARLFLHPPRYRAGTAERVAVPLLVCVAEHDTETNPRAAAEIARAAPRGGTLSYPVGHFDLYEDPWQQRVTEDQSRFLRRHLTAGPAGPAS